MKWFLGMVACLLAIQMSMCQASETPHDDVQICDNTTLAQLAPEPDKPVIVLQVEFLIDKPTLAESLTEAPQPQEVAGIFSRRERWKGNRYSRTARYNRSYASTPAAVPRFSVGVSLGGCANGNCRR